MGGNMTPNAWHQMDAQSLGPSSQASNSRFGSQSAAIDAVTSSSEVSLPILSW